MAEMKLSEINKLIQTDAEGAVRDAEREYHSRVADIADYVNRHSSVRIILLAGPSGSGKTTTANLIADALRARGEETIVVSLDDFYRDSTDADYPRLESGERDFECPEALHLDELAETLCRIAEGREFSLPKYDFKISARAENNLHPPIPEGCVIIEGLHALNPRISKSIPRECVLKLFVSVSTNLLSDDGERILSGRKMRFIRRLVRDSIYRAADAEKTLAMWHNVLAAEDVYLYPFKETADFAFDTFHDFEIGVMKPFAVKLLTDELYGRSDYVRTVRDALDLTLTLDEKLVPKNSLIREFIPGGKYETLY